MDAHRPKLLVLEGPLVPGAEMARMLGDRYDVAVAPAGVGAARLATGGFQVVFGGAGDLASRENILSDRDAGAVLGAISEGLCLASAEGQVLWANARFRAYDEQTRARIGSVCRMAARRFESAAQIAGSAG